MRPGTSRNTNVATPLTRLDVVVPVLNVHFCSDPPLTPPPATGPCPIIPSPSTSPEMLRFPVRRHEVVASWLEVGEGHDAGKNGGEVGGEVFGDLVGLVQGQRTRYDDIDVDEALSA